MKKLTKMLLCLVLMLGVFFAFGFSAHAAEVVDQGTCGDNLTWVLDSDGVLTISGTGPMRNVYASAELWSDHCDSIASVVMEDGVTGIGSYVFSNCSRLAKIDIPAGVTEIGDYAFDNCSSLTEIELPAGLTKIGGWAFNNCSNLAKIDLPAGVTEIGWYAFNNCSRLTEIELPAGVTEIGEGTFSGCSSLTEINIPTGVIGIGRDAFYGCSRLAKIELPAGLTEIGNWAFSGCSMLAKIELPAGLTEIGWWAFYNCSSLTEINLPAGVTEIGGQAFYNCSSLTEINLPAELIEIGEGAFIGCSSLTEIDLPAGLIEIGESAFCGCSSLTEINLPAGLTEIDARMFLGCFNLSSITIPQKVEYIGEEAFEYCTQLKSITFTGDAPTIHGRAFYNTTAWARYPANNTTWTADKLQNYGGQLTWLPDNIANGVARIFGNDRFETAFKTADEYKAVLGVDKFQNVIIASGMNFADALAGSYLACVKDAPILLSGAQNDQSLKNYLDANLAPGGQVYILGGTAAVPATLDSALQGYNVKRLAGGDRFETNILILKEAGVTNEEILVCTAYGFADSLSASAVGKPILLVNNPAGQLNDMQRAYLAGLTGDFFCIIGGEAAVGRGIENELWNYGRVGRLAGADRYMTSVLTAKRYFDAPSFAVLAYAQNFPDGLCGGPLAAALNAPLILTMTGQQATAADYARENGISDGYVLGGAGLIDDAAVRDIFRTQVIAVK